MLVSLYIENHPYLFEGKPQTINFGGKYLYSFEKNGNEEIVISRRTNDQHIEGFFNISGATNVEVSLASALVGENGAGKSSLIDIISKIFNNELKNEFNYFLIFINKDSCFYISNLKKTKLQKFKINEFKFEHSDISTLYYTSHITLFDSFNSVTDDISAKKFVLDDFSRTQVLDKNYLLGIDTYSSIRRIDFLKSKIFAEINNKIDFPNVDFEYGNVSVGTIRYFKSPSDISIKFIVDDFLLELEKIKKVLHEEREALNNHKFYRDLTKNNFIESSIKQLYHLIMPGLLNNTINYETKGLTINNFLETFLTYIYDLFFKDKDDERYFLNYTSEIINLKDTFFLEIDNSEIVSKDGFKLKYSNIENLVTIESNVLKHLNVLTEKSDFFIKTYIPGRIIIFDQSRTLSSGEKYFFNLFENLNNFLTNNIISSNNLIFFIDEGDNGFHPQWKKKYLNILLKSIPLFFEHFKDKLKLQIVITTHDPLTLSDFPSSNVIFLRKEGIVTETIPSTFGANIAELLSHSFFIDDGLIGDFAKDKITEVINWINVVKKEKEKPVDIKQLAIYEKVIELIDERVLKMKLIEMISELKENEDEFYNQQIEKEIERLKKLKRNIDK